MPCSAKCDTNILGKCLSRLLGSLGEHVGNYPKGYIFASVAISFFLASGLQQIVVENDIHRLYLDFDSESGDAWRTVEKNFPVNYTAFQPDRISLNLPSADIMFKPKNSSVDLLSIPVLQEIAELENRVRNLTVNFMGKTFGYEDVCARWHGQCYESALTKLIKSMAAYQQGNRVELDWPVQMRLLKDGNWEEIHLPLGLGSVITDEDDKISNVTVVKSSFFFRDDGELNERIMRAWEAEFDKLLEEVSVNDQLHLTRVIYDDSDRISRILTKVPLSILKDRLSYATVGLAVFCMVAFWTPNRKTSKPLLGLVGMASCGLATAATFGLLVFYGYEVSVLLLYVPCLAFGVGMDDAFVIIAAWNITDPKLPVPKRMRAAYEEAAVGITLTTLTDVISFAVGATSPQLALYVFCIFCAVSLIATYIYLLVFFGAFLAIYGRYEAEPEMSESSSVSSTTDETKLRKLYGIYASWVQLIRTQAAVETISPGARLRRGYVEFLHHWLAKVFVCATFMAYIAGALYGLLHTRITMDYRTIVPRKEMYAQFIHNVEENFLEYPPPIQIMVAGDLNYSNVSVQQDLDEMLSNLEDSGYFRDSLYTQSWLRGFLGFVERSAEDGITIDISNEEAFIKALKEDYFSQEGYDVEALDVRFEGNKIKASRFLILPKPMERLMDITDTVVYLRSFFKENFTNYDVQHYNMMYLRIAEVILNLPRYAWFTLAGSVVGVVLVTVLLMSSLSCTVYVCGSICTITFGLIGYVHYWMGFQFDGPMVLSLIMCVGFSVDYSAHMAFAYTRGGSGRTTRERLDHAMITAGQPVILGAATTFIGVCGLLNAPTGAITMFSTVVVAVIILGLYHGLVVLPVALLISDELSECWSNRASSGSWKPSDDRVTTAVAAQSTEISSVTLSRMREQLDLGR